MSRGLNATMASEASQRDALQQRVLAAIIDAAARTMARGGEAASMADVASEAGVARGTLYRYFGNRQALEDGVVAAGLLKAEEGLRSGRIEEIAVHDGIRRAVRALLDVGDAFVVMTRRRAAEPLADFDARVAAPLRRMLSAGQHADDIRADIPATWLAEALMTLIASSASSPPSAGREDTIAAVSEFFLTGAGARPVTARAEHPRAARAGGDDD